MNGKNTMKRLQTLSPLLALILVSAAGMASAQQAAGGMGDASATRTQIKMERDEFLKTHRYDEATSNWVLNSGIEPPVGIKSRAEVKSERDQFLRNNRYDTRIKTWMPLKTQPRDLNAMSREEMNSETEHFMRTHRWDEVSGSWMEKAPAMMKN